MRQEAEESPEHRIRLTTFQTDGVLRARRILDRYNGVLIADGVGLGKTFLAGKLIEQTSRQRQRVLLISPASLRDGPWARFASRFQLYLENLSYEELALDKRLNPGSNRTTLGEDPDRYAMVVVDEAHAFRNPDTIRARALRKLLQGSPPKKLVLVTATPVNNSLWDLYNLFTYFVGHDAAFADAGIPSLEGRFDQAAHEDPYDLRPSVLFDLLDKVTVRRTRNFVQRHYPNDLIEKPDGTQVRIRFPEPKPIRLDYELEGVLPGLFRDLKAALEPDKGKPGLTMARYAPSAYLKRGEAQASQVALAGLLRSALLKRFESSAYAFARTCETMAGKHDVFLEFLNRGAVPMPDALADWDEDMATDRSLDEIVAEAPSEPADRYNAVALKADVTADRDLLRDFASRAKALDRERDPKLQVLADALLEILKQAREDASTPDQERNMRKVLVFTYFEDTVDWIEPFVQRLLDTDKRFAGYRGRMASVAGRHSRGVSRDDAVFGFAPESSEAPSGRDGDQFDLLIATDVLAEGLNLQQARHIINYDLPWNPMRLVQRHGRIDRIGSAYDHVYLRCFFPAARLEEMLELEERLRRKIAQAAASIGVESAPLPGVAAKDVTFTGTRQEIEALRKEDPALFVNAGEDPDAHSGEEYRQELRKGLETYGNDRVYALPWGAGSGFVTGKVPGCFFCIRVLEKVFYRFVSADAAAPMVKDTLQCLTLIACKPDTPRYLPPEHLPEVYRAWEKARADVFKDWTWMTDKANLEPRIRPLFRAIAEHLRKHPATGIVQSELEATLSAIEAPWGPRIERELRLAFQQSGTPQEISQTVVDRVRALGLQPYVAPKPLDPIEPDEVNLVCWLAVQR